MNFYGESILTERNSKPHRLKQLLIKDISSASFFVGLTITVEMGLVFVIAKEICLLLINGEC